MPLIERHQDQHRPDLLQPRSHMSADDSSDDCADDGADNEGTHSFTDNEGTHSCTDGEGAYSFTDAKSDQDSDSRVTRLRQLR